jgi:cytoskeletal protein CcmA (bactofilin family)
MWSQEDTRQGRINPAHPGEPPVPIVRKPGDASDVRTAQLGRSICIKGEITGSEDLTVDGQVDGRIDLPDHILTVGPNATVCADITAKSVMVFGSVLGSIVARDKVEIRRSGSIEGSVVCGRLAVQDGAILCGRIETGAKRRPALTAGAERAPQVLAPVA